MGHRDFPFLHEKNNIEKNLGNFLFHHHLKCTLYSTDLDDEKDNSEGHVYFLNGE